MNHLDSITQESISIQYDQISNRDWRMFPTAFRWNWKRFVDWPTRSLTIKHLWPQSNWIDPTIGNVSRKYSEMDRSACRDRLKHWIRTCPRFSRTWRMVARISKDFGWKRTMLAIFECWPKIWIEKKCDWSLAGTPWTSSKEIWIGRIVMNISITSGNTLLFPSALTLILFSPSSSVEHQVNDVKQRWQQFEDLTREHQSAYEDFQLKYWVHKSDLEDLCKWCAEQLTQLIIANLDEREVSEDGEVRESMLFFFANRRVTRCAKSLMFVSSRLLIELHPDHILIICVPLSLSVSF